MSRYPSIRRISLRVRDPRSPERTRWRAQELIQNAAGFGALSGFTTRAAQRQTWISFTVDISRLDTFKRRVRALVLNKRVEVRISGRPYRPRRTRKPA